MRNWNNSQDPWSYSWVLHEPGCILPMRNWNCHDADGSACCVGNNFSLYLTYEELKLYMYFSFTFFRRLSCVVSYLWGIETLLKLYQLQVFSQLYLTYEELKLCTGYRDTNVPIRLYLTYEELKHWNSFHQAEASSGFSLYLTYEELKHAPSVIVLWRPKDFFTLYLTYEELKHKCPERHETLSRDI